MTLATQVPEDPAVQRRLRRALFVVVAAVVVFAVISLLVNARVLAGVDLRVARAFYGIDSPILNRLSELLAILFSGEFSLVYAALFVVHFWRRGMRISALATLAFLPLVFVEIVFKYVVHQPAVPRDLYRDLSYPLVTMVTQGSFPSGHAARSAFFAVFVGGLARSSGGVARWLAPFVATLVVLACALSRLYEEVHWASDVVAGAILGAAIGYLAVCCVGVFPGDFPSKQAQS